MQVQPSGYYAWLKLKSSASSSRPTAVDVATQQLFEDSQHSFGSRRLSHHLKAIGYSVGRYRAKSLMRKLNRDFSADTPNAKWVTDITYVPSKRGWVYLATVMDLYARKIVGWHVDDSMTTALCKQALENAYLSRKPTSGLIHHSDRGVQYTSDAYQQLLSRYEMTCSMSRKGNCWDNSPMERFFRSIKYERLNWIKFDNKEDAANQIVDYITWYNTKRLHTSNGNLTPV